MKCAREFILNILKIKENKMTKITLIFFAACIACGCSSFKSNKELQNPAQTKYQCKDCEKEMNSIKEENTILQEKINDLNQEKEKMVLEKPAISAGKKSWAVVALMNIASLAVGMLTMYFWMNKRLSVK